MPKVIRPEVKTFQQHKHRWENCLACPLSKVRSRVVLVRGTLPCQVLFIGEAPGFTENAIGQPFVGPAGHLLDKIIAKAQQVTVEFSYAVTNVIACIPKLNKHGQKLGEPPVWAIKACKERLQEIIKLAKPIGIVLVGDVAEENVPVPKGCKAVHIDHPAYLLRGPDDQFGMMVQRNVITLAEFTELVCGNN